MPNKSNRAGGFTLIEVLIAILIISIGLFSILAVITVSLRMNTSSAYRTIAGQQATAIAEVLRANPTAVGTTDPAVAVAFSAPGAVSTNANCLNATGCSRNDYIRTAIDTWQKQLSVVLPSGTGTVCLDSTPADGAPTNWQCDNAANAPYVVKVCWDESRVSTLSSASAVTGTGNTTAAGGGVLCTYTSL